MTPDSFLPPMTRRMAMLEALFAVVLAAAISVIWAVGLYLLGFTHFVLQTLWFVPLIVAVSWLLYRRGETWAMLGARAPDSWTFTLLAGSVGAMGGIMLGFYLALALSTLGLPQADLSLFTDILTGNTVLYIEVMIFTVWGTAAVGEELFARGFLLHRFAQVFEGAPAAGLWAALAQSAFFGLAHIYQGPSGVIITMVLGLWLAGLYFLTGRNLLAPMIAHGLINTYSITLIYLGQFEAA